MHNLGLSYTSLKQYDKAIQVFEQSLAISEQLGDKMGQADTCRELGRCLSRHEQHDRAVTCLKHAWAVYQELGDEMDQVRAAKALGEALWARARAEHHQAAPDAASSGGVSAAAADTLQDAETWLQTALDLAVKIGWIKFRVGAQMHLAYVAMLKGDEDEAVELLSQHLQGWLDDVGPRYCAGCGQVRGEDAPMLRCDGCHVARCVNAASPVLCGAETAMLAVRWLTGRRGWMMQVLQCGAPADGVEGRGCERLLWHAAQGHLPAAEAMAAGGQGQGDGGVGGAAGGDGGVPEGGGVGGAGGQHDGSAASRWRG